MTTGICPEHGTEVLMVSQGRADELGIEHGCSEHNAELRARPPVESMTADERVAELRSMDGLLYHGMDLLWERMDALVGRSLMTHERIDFDLLEHEIRTGLMPSVGGGRGEASTRQARPHHPRGGPMTTRYYEGL